MIVVLSGEGPSDLGHCANGQGECQIPDFQHGAMACFVDKEIKQWMGYSLLECTPKNYIFVSKHTLVSAAQRLRENRKSMSLTGKKRPGLETGFFYSNARMLGERAMQLAKDYQDTAIAVLFRDCDGTHSSPASERQAKVNSIRQGFDDAGLGHRGIAMVPKPKSESWMLCVLRDNYQHCARLENLSGNDNVANSAKDQLSAALQGDISAASQLRHLNDAVIDTAQLAGQMPSYGEFHRDMETACQSVLQG